MKRLVGLFLVATAASGLWLYYNVLMGNIVEAGVAAALTLILAAMSVGLEGV